MSLLQKKADNKKTIGAVGIVTSLILITFSSFLFILLKNFIINYLSPDHQLDPGSVFFLKAIFNVLILIPLFYGIIYVLNIKIRIRQWLNSFIDTRTAIDFFLKDDICNKKKFPVYSLAIGTALGLVLHLYFLLYGEPPHEGSMEKLSSFLFLVAGFILIVANTKIKRINPTFDKAKTTSVILTFLSIILLYIFGEEVSWGQRIFKWESFSIFEEFNFQKETNTHNFFNPMFKFVYPAVGMGSFVILCLFWFFPNHNKSFMFNLFLPHPSFFLLFFIMACSSFAGHSEIYEELLSIFCVLYSTRILICLNSQKVRSASVKQIENLAVRR